jgi:hypothetical protein
MRLRSQESFWRTEEIEGIPQCGLDIFGEISGKILGFVE